MAEYIEREATMDAIENWFCAQCPVDCGQQHEVECVIADVVNWIDIQPEADVVEVKHGRWVEQEAPSMDIYYDCSACGESFYFVEGSPADNLYTYCPNCGAKMDLEADNGE